MTLEDFEKALETEKRQEKEAAEREKQPRRSKDHHSSHRHRRRDDDQERRHRSRRDEDEDGHRRKRRRRSQGEEDDQERRHRRDSREREEERRRRRHRSGSRERHRTSRAEHTLRSQSPEAARKENSSVEKPTLKRDAWMEAPGDNTVEIKHRRKSSEVEPVTTRSSRADLDLKIHANELNKHHLEDLRERGDDSAEEAVLDEPAQHEVNYKFGDSGSQWRMTRLKNVHRQAEETGQSIEDVAMKQYGDLRLLDDAREEEIVLERRMTYGDGYVGKEKPSGELFQERKMKAGIRRESRPAESPKEAEIRVVDEEQPPMETKTIDQNALNKLRADMMKAKLRKAPNAADLEAEYERAAAAFANSKQPEVVVISKMDNRMLTGGRGAEVKQVETKRDRERGNVEENEDMSIDDMVRAERRTKGQAGGEGQLLAERIAKDAKFDNDLEYLDENAAKLAKRIQKSEVNLRNMTVASLQKTNRILDQCPLCYHEDRADPAPTAPVVSLATRTYLSLPTEPEINADPHGAIIVPLQHRANLLECDDDEWEEIRNFMKSLTRMYAARKLGVLFYENAARPQRQQHAALIAVPMPTKDKDVAPGFFREAILQEAPEWSQHRKLIDTAAASKDGGMGRMAFRRSIAKQMPYFHIWFTLDGGLGHVVEDEGKWPRGDLFAREVLGEILQRDLDVVRARGKWVRGDRRVDGFRKEWDRWDWTKMLVEEG
jgi:Protein similar to CwfJ C-terminus 2/Protein similar to CwfJ C-terminus 1